MYPNQWGIPGGRVQVTGQFRILESETDLANLRDKSNRKFQVTGQVKIEGAQTKLPHPRGISKNPETELSRNQRTRIPGFRGLPQQTLEELLVGLQPAATGRTK